MKSTKRKKIAVSRRNPMAVEGIMRKGGAHQRVDKFASRARQKASLRRETAKE